MGFRLLLIILVSLVCLCAVMVISVICIKLRQARNNEKKISDMKKIRPVLNKLFAAETINFNKNHKNCLSRLANKLEIKASLQTLEDMLLDVLEDSEGERKARAGIIAYYFGFPEKCLHMIRDRLTAHIAIGCRKAGLYRFALAIPDILNTLDILSSETQLQALMALARIGDIDAMVKAFDKIHPLIFVNERAVNEILKTFSGDRIGLYGRMIFHQSAYLVRLFLKAIDRETANVFIEEIIAISENGGKEMRLAGIIAAGKSDSKKKIPILLRAMNDDEWEIRAMAVKTIGVVNSPRAIKLLKQAACDREWWVRQNAVTSILEYPSCDKILLSIIKTGDKYAYDSLLHTIEKTSRTRLLHKITEVRMQRSRRPGRARELVW